MGHQAFPLTLHVNQTTFRVLYGLRRSLGKRCGRAAMPLDQILGEGGRRRRLQCGRPQPFGNGSVRRRLRPQWRIVPPADAKPPRQLRLADPLIEMVLQQHPRLPSMHPAAPLPCWQGQRGGPVRNRRQHEVRNSSLTEMGNLKLPLTSANASRGHPRGRTPTPAPQSREAPPSGQTLWRVQCHGVAARSINKSYGKGCLTFRLRPSPLSSSMKKGGANAPPLMRDSRITSRTSRSCPLHPRSSLERATPALDAGSHA